MTKGQQSNTNTNLMDISMKTPIIFLSVLMMGVCLLKAEPNTPAASKIWTVKFTAGYNKSAGNTDNDQFAASFFSNRRTMDNELTLKADGFYSSSQGQMDGQKYTGSIRYAYSFWRRKWYNFYKIAVEHDRFADIDQRYIPSTGLGYWWSDKPAFKLMAECGVGYEYTRYYSLRKQSEKGTAVSRIFMEKALLIDSRIIWEETLHTPFDKKLGHRLRSEAAFITALSQHLSLRLSLTDIFTSKPPTGIKKHDVLFISGITYEL